MTTKETKTGETEFVANPLRGIFYIILALVFISVLDATAKYLVRDYPVPMVTWTRYLFHLLTFGVATLLMLGGRAMHTRRPGLHIVRGLLLVAMTLLFITATSLIPLAEATTISFITPLLVTAASALFLGERVGLHRWLSVVVGFIGVLVVIRPGGSIVLSGALFAIGMAFCYAFYQIATRSLNRTENPWTTLLYTAVIGTVVSSAFVPFYWATPDTKGLTLMVITGILGGFGHFFIIKALQHAEASLLAPVFYVQIIYAIIIGYIVFGDLPDAWSIVGVALITGAGLWAWHRQRLHEKDRTPDSLPTELAAKETAE